MDIQIDIQVEWPSCPSSLYLSQLVILHSGFQKSPPSAPTKELSVPKGLRSLRLASLTCLTFMSTRDVPGITLGGRTRTPGQTMSRGGEPVNKNAIFPGRSPQRHFSAVSLWETVLLKTGLKGFCSHCCLWKLMVSLQNFYVLGQCLAIYHPFKAPWIRLAEELRKVSGEC